MVDGSEVLAWQVAPFVAELVLVLAIGVGIVGWRRRHVGMSGRGDMATLADLPPAPRNVRLVDGLGVVHPVELAYRGQRDGIDRWVATALVPLDLAGGFTLMADEVPGRCFIEVAGRRPGPGG